jgi:recombination protein RecR
MARNVIPLSNLIEQFERMPGIGHKSAQKLAFYILSMSNEEAKKFADNILLAKEKIHRCNICCDLTDGDTCSVCSDDKRDHSVICVVESSKDVIAIERTREYNGLYHVLHGSISPMNGIGPDEITIKELISRLNDDSIKEIIMATNPTVEGEATAMYISRLIKPMGIKVSRLAYGVPVGADLEYADEITLTRALEGRQLL